MDLNWNEIWEFSMSPWEIVVRGTLTYWFIFILLRMAGRRDIGSLGIADLLVIVLIADAAQNAMAGEYTSVSDGAVLIATIVFWSVVIDRVGYYSPMARRLLEPSKLCLIKDGVVQRRALRQEHISMEELESELRMKGVMHVSDVFLAYMEPDGAISVIKQADGKAAPNHAPERTEGEPRFRDVKVEIEALADGGFRGRLTALTEVNGERFLDAVAVAHASPSRESAEQSALQLQRRLGLGSTAR